MKHISKASVNISEQGHSSHSVVIRQLEHIHHLPVPILWPWFSDDLISDSISARLLSTNVRLSVKLLILIKIWNSTYDPPLSPGWWCQRQGQKEQISPSLCLLEGTNGCSRVPAEAQSRCLRARLVAHDRATLGRAVWTLRYFGRIAEGVCRAVLDFCPLKFCEIWWRKYVKDYTFLINFRT